jgi:hypothetical protein
MLSLSFHLLPQENEPWLLEFILIKSLLTSGGPHCSTAFFFKWSFVFFCLYINISMQSLPGKDVTQVPRQSHLQRWGNVSTYWTTLSHSNSQDNLNVVLEWEWEEMLGLGAPLPPGFGLQARSCSQVLENDFIFCPGHWCQVAENSRSAF